METRPANASSAVRHRSDYYSAAATGLPNNGTQSVALDNSQFGSNSRMETINRTESALEMAVANVTPLEPSHVTRASSVRRASTVTCFPVAGHSTAEFEVDNDVTGTSCVIDQATERVIEYDDENISTNICYSTGDADQSRRRASDFQSESFGKQTVPVEETDDFYDPVADGSYTERTMSECDSDKNSLTGDHCRQSRLSDSLINDNSSDVSECSSSFSSGFRIVCEVSVEGDVR
jgi:hypothetical protein